MFRSEGLNMGVLGIVCVGRPCLCGTKGRAEVSAGRRGRGRVQSGHGWVVRRAERKETSWDNECGGQLGSDRGELWMQTPSARTERCGAFAMDR